MSQANRTHDINASGSAGVVGCILVLNGNIAVPDVTETDMDQWTAQIDTDSLYNGSKEIVILDAGVYSIFFQMLPLQSGIAPSGSRGFRGYLYRTRSGTAKIIASDSTIFATYNNLNAANLATERYLQVGDKLKVSYKHNLGSGRSISANSYFGICTVTKA